MKREKICGIYCITNLINGKMYVGQSVDIYHRWYNHSTPSTWEQSSGPMYDDMKKYSTDYFELSILEKCDKTELNEREYYWTLKLQTHITGYNRDIGTKRCSETKQKISEAHKGNTNMLGKHHSDETKHKMSEVHKGNKNALGHRLNDEAKQKIGDTNKGNTVARGRIWITNNFENKRIYPDELEKYIELGYQRGMK